VDRLSRLLLGFVVIAAGCGDNLGVQTSIDGSVRLSDVAIDAALQLQILTPSPYLKKEDSPFKNLTTWYVEDFEDAMLDDVPGTTDNNGHNTRSLTGDVDSVDNDDGQLNNQCANCDAWHVSAGELRFTFAPIDGLPTHAGLVWTDAAIAGLSVTFEAFDGNGLSLGTTNLPNHSDAVNNGTTAEDRFFGVISPQGVGSIRIVNSSGGIEIDHLQWGR